MSATARPGTLHQAGNAIRGAHLTQRIHFFHPAVICVSKVQCFGTFFMIVKIKHQKPTGSIRKQRINPNHIGTIWLFAPQMDHDLLWFQLSPFPIRTVPTFDFLSGFLRAQSVLPQVFTLRVIASLSRGFVDTALAVNICPTPEVGIKPTGKLLGYHNGSDFFLACIWNPCLIQKVL